MNARHSNSWSAGVNEDFACPAVRAQHAIIGRIQQIGAATALTAQRATQLIVPNISGMAQLFCLGAANGETDRIADGGVGVEAFANLCGC